MNIDTINKNMKILVLLVEIRTRIILKKPVNPDTCIRKYDLRRKEKGIHTVEEKAV